MNVKPSVARPPLSGPRREAADRGEGGREGGRKGDRGEMQRVKFNLGMTSLPATKRTRTDADGGGGAEGGGRGSALLSPLESGSGCRTADFWTSGVDEAWESATDLTAVAAAGLVKLSPCGAPLI